MTLLKKVMERVLQFTPEKEPDPLIGEGKYIGKAMKRVDGVLKVTGQAQFTAEYKFDNIAYAALAYSTIAKGKITTLDTADAESSGGVITVITYKNAPKIGKPALMDPSGGSSGAMAADIPVLQDERIYWNGQPIAVVVAETQDQADEAVSLIKVEYEEEKAVVSFESELPNAKTPKDVLGEDPEVKVGNAEEAYEKSAHKVDHVYRTPRYNHNAIEPHATIAHWESDEKLVVFDASQMLYAFKNTFAKMFLIKPENVEVLSPFVGGGFGGKGSMWQHSILCVAAARAAKRPVKLNLSREGVYRIVGGRTPSVQHVALGANQDGQLEALIHHGTTQTTEYNNFAEQFSFPARYLYNSKTFDIGQKVVHTDTLANTFMRAPGESIGTFALESAMDELAHEMNIDPIKLREINEPKSDPLRHIPFSCRNIVQAYKVGAESFGWDPKKPGSQSDGKWRVGQGVATAYYPYYRFPGKAKAKIFSNGTASIQAAAHEMGMGTATVQLQHFADRMTLPIEQVSMQYGNTSLPESPMAGGSNQTASLGASIEAAVTALVEVCIKAANKSASSPFKGLHAKDVDIKSGGIYGKETDVGCSFVEILKLAGVDELEAEGASGQPFEMLKHSMHSYGAQFCEVRVHSETGELRIARWLACFDAGRIINPKTAESQFRGGIIMGIGMALMEETIYDDRYGRVANPSLAEYHMPVHLDIPHIEIKYLNIPDEHAPLGARGIGEIGITGAAAAIANAVFNATGRRIRELPITLDKLL
ncbi:xanthine dehydrogenase family protein molybdopterin-binding subunit [Candidatus Obscuribacterales bacterium]|nr:xanthine dehydrogenase family protein molybdopterin-binding subunit [Candidatus Obscuribacterales bacterium]MBX3150970.1 xanthine dehydrogenase family protein molybdopterin-binding subunit [Candidatus Obscuribacterales bacterium]